MNKSGKRAVTVDRVRDQTIDIAKGLAIMAIVLGHVLRGLASAGLIDSMSGSYAVSDRALYMVHLTVFAFLSGLFVARGAEKEGTAGYLRGRLGNFLYLYLVWQTLQVAVKLWTASLVNSAPDINALIQVWKPEGQMWFLPWLIVVTVLTTLIGPWRNTTRARLGIIGIGAISCAAWGFNGPYVGMQGLALLIFFVLGAYIRFDRLSTGLARLDAFSLCIVAAGGTAVYAIMLVWSPAVPPTVSTSWSISGLTWGFLASWAGLVAVLSISASLARLGAGFTWLAFIGQRSLEIFLAHIIAASGTRIVLERLGMDDPFLHILAGMISGILGPLVLWRVSSRLGVTLLFQSPFVRRWSGGTQQLKHVLPSDAK